MAPKYLYRPVHFSHPASASYVKAALAIIGLAALWMNRQILVLLTPWTDADAPDPDLTAPSASRGNHNDLPRCEKLMQNPSSPFADGAFLTRKTTQVVWKMRHDGSRELTLPLTCQLKRYTARQAGMCLKNKSLLFIGDSLTRYQYLSLAYFLEHKKWPPRYQATRNTPCRQVDEHNNTACSTIDKPSVCCEYYWEIFGGNGGWQAFMQNLGGGTDGTIFHGRMEAPSVRAPVSVENYQYVSSEEDGRTRLTCIGEFGWNGNEPFRGWNFSGCAHNGTCRYTPESYQNNLDRLAKNDLDYDYPDITTAFSSNSEFHAQYQNTSYIFYNRGLWGALQEDKAKSMMEAIQNMTGGKDMVTNRCFFKSTTGCQRSRQNNLDSVEYGHVRTATFSSGCEYFDVAHATEEFSHLVFDPKPPPMLVNEFNHIFWDSVHYLPWVYEELNNLLLNVLCNLHTFEE